MIALKRPTVKRKNWPRSRRHRLFAPNRESMSVAACLRGGIAIIVVLISIELQKMFSKSGASTHDGATKHSAAAYCAPEGLCSCLEASPALNFQLVDRHSGMAVFSSINSTHYSESLSLQPSNRSEVYAAEWRDVLDGIVLEYGKVGMREDYERAKKMGS